MAKVEVDSSEEGLFTNPVPALLVGLALAFAAYVTALLSGSAGLPVAPLLLALLAMGTAINIAPKTWWVVGSGVVVALLAMMTADHARWDASAILLFKLAACFAFFCTATLVLADLVESLAAAAGLDHHGAQRWSSGFQRCVVSLVLLFHFGGIVTAVSSAPPQPFLAHWVWHHVYRPYLQFMYLNNAYHFYSPEPGPATLLWFRIEYESDDPNMVFKRWVKLPELDDDGTPIEYDADGHKRRLPFVEYTRRLSMAEQTNTQAPAPANFLDLQQSRIEAGKILGIPPVPIQAMPLHLQYREPTFIAKKWIASYARYVARHFQHAQFPHKKATGVKVYRVQHNIVPWSAFASTVDQKSGLRIEGQSWKDLTLYVPVYMGEFDADGVMKPSCRERFFLPDGTVYDKTRDPFLYWIIPILPRPKEGLKVPPYNYEIDNFMKKHAGDAEEETKP